MFTGIVETVGSVVRVEPAGGRTRLVLDAGGWGKDAEAGESIAVAGVCLTVIGRGSLAFDVVPETLAKTTLGRLRIGSRVNLERCVRASTLMGGHVVQGHVEGLARVESVETRGEYRLRLRPPAETLEAIIPKGSIALDGVALTLARVEHREGFFEVALIPATLERTTLGELRPGDDVNLETDILSRTIVHWMRNYSGSLPSLGSPRASSVD